MKRALLVTESSVYTDMNGDFICRGGGEAYFHSIAKALLKMGIVPTVYAIKEFNDQKNEEYIDGIFYKRMSEVTSRSSIKIIKYLFKARNESYKYDLIVMNQFLPHLISPWIKKSKKIGIIYDIYNKKEGFSWIKEFGFFIGMAGLFSQKLQLYCDKRFVDSLIVISQTTYKKLSDVFLNKFIDKINVCSYPVDINSYDSKAKKEDLLLFIGRFIEYKHPSHVLDVFNAVKKQYPQYKAVFICPRFSERIMEHFNLTKQKLGLKDGDVILKTHCFDKEKKELLAKAKVLVHPSEVEGQGIVILEALASNTPVAAYDLEVYKNVLKSGNNSELAKVGDINDLSVKCIKILNNFEEYKKHCLVSLGDFTEYGFEQSIKRIIKTLDRQHKNLSEKYFE